MNDIFDFLGLEPTPVRATERHNPSKVNRWPWLAQALQRDSWAKSAVRRMLPDGLRTRLFWWVRDLNSMQRKPPPMAAETRAALLDYFRPFNEELATFLGRDLAGWQK